MKTRIYNDLGAVLAKDQAQRVARRDQRRLERDADPAWQEVRRIRQEIGDRERAEKATKEAEASKHALVGWPGGLSAHIDRGSARAKASFVPYLAKALADYERDNPDQAPAPAPTLSDGVDDVIHHRELESRARARRLLEDGVSAVKKAKMLEVRHSYIGDQEFSARLAVRQQLQGAADPLEDHETLVGEATPMPAPVEAEPPKRGRGRPPKFMQRVEVTDDGAIIED